MRSFLALFLSAVLVGCGGGSTGSSESPLDQELREIIVAFSLTGDPAAGRQLPQIEEPLPQLGKKLFVAKSLGGDFDSACITCHLPSLGGGDALSLPIGAGADVPDLLGPGRTHPDGDFTVPRNAPSTFNLGFFDRALFWDGRVESLGKTPSAEGGDGAGIRTPDVAFLTPDPLAGLNLAAAQARFPVTSVEEMRGESFVHGGGNEQVRSALAARLSESPAWQEEFALVYGDPMIGYDRIAEALAAFQRSQVFIENPWKFYVEGYSGALSESQKRGALLFFRTREEGGSACFTCHSGNFFTDERFYGIGAPQIGRGKGDGVDGLHDFGRARETGDPQDRFTFRTPSLLNVAHTGPYTHAGALLTLEEVVRFHLDPVAGLHRFDPNQVVPARSTRWRQNSEEAQQWLQQQAPASRRISTLVEPLPLSDAQVQDLVAFLNALTDPCVADEACLAPWMPSARDDVDGTVLLPQ